MNDDLDPVLRAKLEKFGLIMDANAASVSASSKANKQSMAFQLAEEVARKKLVKQLEESLSLSKEEAAVVAKRIKTEEDSIAAEKARQVHDKEMGDKRDAAINKWTGVAGQAMNAIAGLTTSAMSSQQAVYKTKEVFSAAVPTIDLFASTIKSVSNVISSLFSGIPIYSGIASAADKAATALVDLAVSSVKIQLERAQQFVSAMNDMSKSGITFGSNLKNLQETAAAAGLSVATYSDFLKRALPDLQSLGGDSRAAGQRIANLGAEVLKTDGKLLTMYGSYEDFYAGIADFQARLVGFGMDITKQNKNMTKSTIDFLYTQKELTELTGKSAEQYKKEAKERDTNLAFQLQLQKLNPESATTVQNTLSMVGEYFQKPMELAMTEAIANGTFNINMDKDPANAKLLSMMTMDQKTAINEVLQRSKLGDQSGVMAGLKQMATATAAAAKNPENAALARDLASGQTILKMLPEQMQQNMQMQSSVISHLQTLEKLPEAFKTLQERDKAAGNQAEAFAHLLEVQQTIGKKIDQQVVSTFGRNVKLTEDLFALQQKLVDKFPDFGNSVDKFAQWVDRLMGGSGETQTPAETIRSGGYGPHVSLVRPPRGGTAHEEWTGPRYGESAYVRAGLTGLGRGTAENPSITAAGKSSLAAVRDLIASVESPSQGYSGFFANKTALELGGTKDLTQMTIGEVLALQARIPKGQAAGKYQFMRSTLEGLLDNSITKDTLFTAEVQDKLADKLLKSNAGYDLYAEGGSKESFLQRLSGIWRGLPNSPGQIKGAATDTVGNKANMGWNDALGKLMAKGGITDGPSIAGEAGPEAVIPLPDGRNVPVRMDMSELSGKMDKMIDILTDHKRVSDKILMASS